MSNIEEKNVKKNIKKGGTDLIKVKNGYLIKKEK